MMKQVTTILAILVGFTMNAQLVSVTENGNTGQRLQVSNASNHGDIGSNAVDLSYSASSSSTRGATGEYATARISQLMVYNRALTTDEITQNFNSTRFRYGL